jgi:hypothetical protein
MNVFIPQTWGKWEVAGQALPPLPAPTGLSYSKDSSRIAKRKKKMNLRANKKSEICSIAIHFSL